MELCLSSTLKHSKCLISFGFNELLREVRTVITPILQNTETEDSEGLSCPWAPIRIRWTQDLNPGWLRLAPRLQALGITTYIYGQPLVLEPSLILASRSQERNPPQV